MTAGSRKERGSRKDQPIHHLILLAKNMTGYRNLMKLCSIGHLEGFHYKPRIDMESLAAHHEGIICLSACLGARFLSTYCMVERKKRGVRRCVIKISLAKTSIWSFRIMGFPSKKGESPVDQTGG